MCFANDGEGDNLGETQRRARKERHCDECRVPILRGETYTRIAWAYCGSVSTLSICRVCVRKHELIYAREIAEGCAPWESYPTWGGDDVADYLADRGLRYDPIADALVLQEAE